MTHPYTGEPLTPDGLRLLYRWSLDDDHALAWLLRHQPGVDRAAIEAAADEHLRAVAGRAGRYIDDTTRVMRPRGG